MKHKPILSCGLAAVRAVGVCAGTMESSKGKRTETPNPRRAVRRERCFLRYKRHRLCPLLSDSTAALAGPPSYFHLKRRAPDHAQHQRGEAIVLRRRAPHNLAH